MQAIQCDTLAEAEFSGQVEYALYSAMLDAIRFGLDVDRILREAKWCAESELHAEEWDAWTNR